MSTFSAGGKVFVTNLFWQTVGGAARGAAAARAQARKLPLEIGTPTNIVVRRTSPPQFGVSFSDAQGVRPGQFAAAAVLADALGGTWAGLFDVPNGWYLVACRRGFVDPDTDRLFARHDADAARRVLQDVMVEGKTKTIYAPASLNVPGTKDFPIDKLLAQQARGLKGMMSRQRLAPLDTRIALRQKLLRLAPFAAAPLALALLARPAWVAVDQRLHPPPPPPLQLPPPWEGMPAAAPFISQCVGGVLSYPQLPGARLKSAQCRGDKILFHYTPYTPLTLPLVLGERAVPRCQLTASDKADLQFSCDLDPTPKIGRQTPVARDAAARRMWESFGLLGGGVELSAPHPVINPAGGLSAIEMTVKARGSAPPDMLLHAIADLQTLSVSTVEFATPNTWYIEGVLYAR